MNWTEGVRARARKTGRNGDLLRQREYFAKSRTRHNAGQEFAEQSHNAHNQATVTSGIYDYINAAEAPIHQKPFANANSTKKRRSSHLATSPPKESTRDPNSPVLHHKGASQSTGCAKNGQIDALGDILAKKQRLLNKADWTGISLQKPLNIKYPQPIKHAKESYASRNISQISNIGAKKRPSNAPSKADDVRVRVGSQNFR